MSRHGYRDDCWDDDNNIHIINYRGAVASAFRGARGQAFMQEMLESMAALPTQELVAGELVGTTMTSYGHWGMFEVPCACALGSVALRRGMDVSNLDIEDYTAVAAAFGISEAMAREIMYENDEYGVTDAARFSFIRRWIEGELYERK
jgi:hypothetical protein